MKHKNTDHIKIQGFFMLQLVVLTFITAVHKKKYFLTSFSLDSILRGFSHQIVSQSRRLVFLYLL